MAENKNLTIFQRLASLFGPNGPRTPKPSYDFDKEVLLRTDNKGVFDKEKLQAQQSAYITNQWSKVENQLYQQAVYYEPTRLASYYDYESMEFTPEISAALDIMADEATTMSEQGFMLNIYSESKRIKSILADLFNGNIDIETNLPMWIRNTCKYGDNFVYLKVDPKKGVIGVNQLPNIEIERLENKPDAYGAGAFDGETEERKIEFGWKDKDMVFKNWEVAHFRLLGDDRRLPYGTSVLDKSRRIWKQLLLAEDAMLIYRTSRAPERRVFKVYVGNMDDKDVEAYVQRIANKFKRDQVVDPQNGNVDLRYNQLAVDQDYFIPVRDPAAPMPIETLPGAQNLSEIADIEYIQKKLLAALRVPKAFLGFEDVVGEGKNLSLQDIRFARTINHIQKAIIQELNKIAIIHLYILGFEDELDNFTLGLTNPSTQSDLLKIELWKEKVTLYRDCVTDPGNGIQATSSTWAKKNVLGMSDEEVKLDLQQQRIEKAVGEELSKTGEVITSTGIFDKIDALYGTPEDKAGAEAGAGAEEGEEAGGFGETPPPAGGDTDLGGETPEEPPAEEGGAGGADMGADLEIEMFTRESDLPLILEDKSNNGTIKLNKGIKELVDVSKNLEDLLKD
tara:strand:+ start:588 stop:2450 length:1863 start_codon:yes stop_codon:yes gene_type:complete